LKIKIDAKYTCAFFVLLVAIVMIALFAGNGFIRNSFGDVLVVVLIYCFIKSFIRNEIKLLWLYIFIFAVLVEIGQYFNLVDLLGLGEYMIARIIIGTTFDIWDIVCYFVGCVGIWLFETVMRKRQIKNEGK
jgi:DNA integrity scanning protein DisA with diadenylate cyclase activity